MKEFLLNNFTSIITLSGIIVSIVTFYIATDISNKREFIKTFDDIYKKTFSLRSKITEEVCHKSKIEFHYELDTILMDKQIEAMVLDYLTEIENLSLIVISRIKIYCKKPKMFIKLKKYITEKLKWIPHKLLIFNNVFSYISLFKKLSSIELYRRLLCLYPYILYKRKENNNSDLFSNYSKLLFYIKDIKIGNDANLDRIYVGIRDSDIKFSQNYFKSSVCLFGNTYEKSFQKYRANQNYKPEDFTSFYAEKMKLQHKSYQNNAQYKIMFYNQRNVYEQSNEIKNHCFCYNDEQLLNSLNNKIDMKEFLSKNSINIIPYCVINGENLKTNNIKKIIGSERFIVQTVYGGGGIGTYLLDTKLLNQKKDVFLKQNRYIVSKYIPNSISVNTHVFISDTANLITPGSIQIIEEINNQLLYKGADFISYREDISKETREEIRILSIRIANILRDKGYRGVLGIDYIIDNKNHIYCSEINPRFQASSILLNKYLALANKKMNKEINESKSIYEINEDTFDGIIKNSISYYDEINYSCYFYYNDHNLTKDDIDCKLNLLKEMKNKIVTDVNEDSYNEFDEQSINEKSYLFRAIFNSRISSVSPDHTLWISENIKLVSSPKNRLKLKISLVNQGVRLLDDINKSNYKKAVFGGIDYIVKEKGMYINSPIGFGFYELSPFSIKRIGQNDYLYYYSKKISCVQIDADHFESGKNNYPNYLKDIIYISADRMRIKLINGCDFKNNGIGCKFCELNYSKKHYSLSEIETAIKISKNFDFDHIMIGGGTDLSDDYWDKVVYIAKKLKKELPNKSISLMSIPAPINKIKELHKAGIDDVAFNIEVYDSNIASKLMPGKRDDNFSYYYNSLKKSAKCFGKGNVRSAFVVGLEPTASLLEGVEKICKIKVIPCLSILRTMPKTLNSINPPNDYLEDIYYKVQKIASNHHLEIGPICDACKNNMLAI